MSLFDTAIAGALASVRSVAGGSVTYLFNDDTTAPVTAVAGTTVWEVIGDDGVQTQVETRDFLIGADELLLDEQPVEPVRGHRIRETDALGWVRTYEVMSPQEASPVWRWSDRGRSTRRIHTKLISEVARL